MAFPRGLALCIFCSLVLTVLGDIGWRENKAGNHIMVDQGVVDSDNGKIWSIGTDKEVWLWACTSKLKIYHHDFCAPTWQSMADSGNIWQTKSSPIKPVKWLSVGKWILYVVKDDGTVYWRGGMGNYRKEGWMWSTQIYPPTGTRWVKLKDARKMAQVEATEGEHEAWGLDINGNVFYCECSGSSEKWEETDLPGGMQLKLIKAGPKGVYAVDKAGKLWFRTGTDSNSLGQGSGWEAVETPGGQRVKHMGVSRPLVILTDDGNLWKSKVLSNASWVKLYNAPQCLSQFNIFNDRILGVHCKTRHMWKGGPLRLA